MQHWDSLGRHCGQGIIFEILTRELHLELFASYSLVFGTCASTTGTPSSVSVSTAQQGYWKNGDCI